MVEDTPSHAQRAETSEGDISLLGFVEEKRKGASLGCFRELKDDPNRQLTETTFYTVKEKKMRHLGLIAKDNVGEQAGIINMVHCEDGSIRRELDKDPGKPELSMSFGLQLICDTYGCSDEVDDEDAVEDADEDADEDETEAATENILTRNKTVPEEVRMGTIGQSGPAYLTLPREQWLFSRQSMDTVPGDEMRPPKAEFNLAVVEVGNREAMTKSNNLDKTVRVMAWLFEGLICADRDKVHNALTVKDNKVAKTLQFAVST